MPGTDITWTNERRKLCDLVPWDHNPRSIKEAEGKRLIESLEDFGQIQTIAVGPDNSIYDGHQRRYVWAASAKFGPDYEVDVRVSSRPLTEKERQKLVVFLHRGTIADWDWDELANSFDVPDLLEWGFTESELQLGEDDDNYSRKVEAPNYQPMTETRPNLSDTFDDSKARALIAEIDAAEGITDEEREFLRIAAQRHTVLHFKTVADYYAWASPEMQRLMENSALVIIDLGRAIELGYASLTRYIAEMVGEDYGNG